MSSSAIGLLACQCAEGAGFPGIPSRPQEAVTSSAIGLRPVDAPKAQGPAPFNPSRRNP
jgi:hypothetical protein